jgi:hypothetical protein
MDAGLEAIYMRILRVVALGAALGGCAASRQEVVSRLGDEYVGQSVDALVIKFGPPASTFKMNSGDTSYIWQRQHHSMRHPHAMSPKSSQGTRHS